MTNIRNISLEFSCQEKLNKDFSCDKCSRKLIDFRSKTDEELQAELNKSDESVCGIFKKSQLSKSFLNYAAATLIVSTNAFSAPAKYIYVKNSHVYISKSDIKKMKDFGNAGYLGYRVDNHAIPVGGFDELLKSISDTIKLPPSLKVRGKTYVEFLVDVEGKMKDVKISKSFNEIADAEVIRALTSLNFPFTPAKKKGIPVDSKVMIPILFEPGKINKRNKRRKRKE